jgi:hypothetical protein
MTTKLDKVCYNDNLLVFFLPLWVPSVKPSPPTMTDPEVCSERETNTTSLHVYHLAFLLLGVIVSLENFIILLPPPGTGSFCLQPSFPPEHGWPGGLHYLFTAAKTERNLKSFYFEHYYNEKARIAIWRGASSPVAHLFITNYGQPRAFPETNNSSLKREFRHQYHSLFASPVKWWLDRLSVDANIIIAGIFNLSTMG